MQAAVALHDLCKLVDGLPLALELAATWTPTMLLAEIVSSIRRGLDLLATDLHDVPARHRSIQAVFDTSWQLLTEEERNFLCMLAYFRGGFSAEAAQKITGATPQHLQILVSKSFLRLHAERRYSFHELIRQYARGKLAENPLQSENVAQQHAAYFAAFLAAREEAIKGDEYLQAKDEIQAEIDNIRQAWEWAVAHPAVNLIQKSFETLHYYFLNTQGLFQEAAWRFQQAAEQLAEKGHPEMEPLTARLWNRAAVNYRMLGQLEIAEPLLQRSLDIFRRHRLDSEIARNLSTLAVIKMMQQDKETAKRLGEEAVARFRELELPIDLILTLNNFGYILNQSGEFETSIEVMKESIERSRHANYPHGLLSALNILGVAYSRLGELDQAKNIFQELVALCRESGTPSRLAQAVNNLGSVYVRLGDTRLAQPFLEDATTLYESVGQLHYAAFVNLDIGEIELDQGEIEKAREYCLDAIRIAHDLKMSSLAANSLFLWGQIRIAEELFSEAASIFSFLSHEPSTLLPTKEKAADILESLRANLAPKAFTAARQRGEAWTLEIALFNALDEVEL